MKTLYRVIKEGLKKTGYEGLYNDRLTCGCERNDIAPPSFILFFCPYLIEIEAEAKDARTT